MQKTGVNVYAWFVLLSFSALFFLVTAATFTSLGVVLPDMVNELGWNWTTAGAGFTILGISCGLSSAFPAAVIRTIGVRVTVLFGTIMLTGAMYMLYGVQSAWVYFLACALAGTGHSFVSSLPGTYMIARNFKNQSSAFGIYFTIAGIGGVVGPLIYFAAVGMFDDWRMHWMFCAIGAAVVGLITILFIREGEDEDKRAEEVELEAMETVAPDVHVTTQTWTVKQALRTPQFYIICAGYITFLFCGITVNSLSVGHLTEAGLAMSVAGGLLSFEAAVNAGSRAISGFIGDYLDPKRLAIAGLILLIAGMLALGAGHSWTLLIIYAVGIGAGYGVTFLATSVLLMNYFGRGPYLELFSIMNFAAGIASLGPIIGGFMRDTFNSFPLVFFTFTAIPVIVLFATIVMRPPVREDGDEASDLLDAGLGEAPQGSPAE